MQSSCSVIFALHYLCTFCGTQPPNHVLVFNGSLQKVYLKHHSSKIIAGLLLLSTKLWHLLQSHVRLFQEEKTKLVLYILGPSKKQSQKHNKCLCWCEISISVFRLLNNWGSWPIAGTCFSQGQTAICHHHENEGRNVNTTFSIKS